MRVLANKIGHQLFCMVCGEWFLRFPTGCTCCTMLYHMFLSLGCIMNCARVCSSRPKLFATKRVVFGKTTMNSSLFWLPKTSAVWLDPIGFILFFLLEPTSFTIVFHSKLGKKAQLQRLMGYVTNCLNLVDIWCDSSKFGLFNFCLNILVEVESIGVRGLNARNWIYSCIDPYVLLTRWWHSKNMKQNMLPFSSEILYTWLCKIWWNLVEKMRKSVLRFPSIFSR